MNANGVPSKPQQALPPRSSNPPNQTLYLQNLNDKIAKPDLRRALYTLFSTHGHILDIVALKTAKMRGQAHIVYRDVRSSTQAMQALQGTDFLGRELKISYGKGRSDIISKLEGTVKVSEPSKPTGAVSNEASKSTLAPPPSTVQPPQPPIGTLKPPNGVDSDGSRSPQGTKRAREDGSDGSDEPMQEDDEEGEAMDVSDED